MAKVTNAFTTYSAVGNREDLSNAIYNIDPFDTPVMSAIRRRAVKNRTFDWQTENLPTVAPSYNGSNANGPAGGNANANFEGFQLSNGPAQPTVRRTNVTQISERDATVSGTQEESDAAGKGSEMAHQMAMAAKVLKSDIETALCSRQQRVDGSDTVPRVTEGFAHWLARAVDKFGNAATGASGITVSGGASAPGTTLPGTTGAAGTASTVTTSGSAANDAPFAAPTTTVTITEAMLGDAMQGAYINGGSPSLWIVPPGPKRTISTFTGRSTTQVLVGKTEVVSTIDVIATDFGRIKVAPSRWVPTDVGLLIDPDYAAVAFFRSFRQFLMARVGDAETRMIVAEWGLEMRNQMAHVLFSGIKK